MLRTRGIARPGPFGTGGGAHQAQLRTSGRPNRKRGSIIIVEAEDIDTEMIGSGALAMKDIEAAASAEKMLGPPAVPFIECEQVLPLFDTQRRLRHFHHPRATFHAQRTIACGQLGRLVGDGKEHAAAMTRSAMTGGHGGGPADA